VSLELLWTEYQRATADGGSGLRPYQYSQFCARYQAYKKVFSLVMRQTHRAGEKSFIDFSGKKPRLVDRETGAWIEVQLFVMVEAIAEKRGIASAASAAERGIRDGSGGVCRCCVAG
jgi:transposase